MKKKPQKIRNGERVRLEGLVHQQADELKIKTEQLKDKAENHIKDVALIWKKESEINEQREELLHVTRVGKLAEFVSSLAHEISQPLTAILSYAQAAQRMLEGREPQIKEILQHIIDDNHRASEVIQRMRSLLKKGKPEMETLDINAVVNETVMLVTTDAAVRNDALKIELESDLPLIHGDRIQLQQVLLNLISNSFDALGRSQGKREILIRTLRKGSDTIIVEVKDSGCGILAKNIASSSPIFLRTSRMAWVWDCLSAAPLLRRMAAN